MTTVDVAYELKAFDDLSLEEYTRYQVADAKTINVLVVGRSGTGKTTLMNSLKNKDAVAAFKKGYSDTKEPTCYPFILVDRKFNIVYQLNILDTPGLQEHRIDPKENRSDDTLLNLAMRCIEFHVTFLNVVCFVSKAGETYEHDVAAFNKLVQFLGNEYTSNSMIILTHAEKITKHKIDDYKNELKSHPVTKPLWEYCKLGVFTSGTVNIESMEIYAEDVARMVVQTEKKNIAPMRDMLLEAMVSCADMPVQIHQLDHCRREIEKKQQQIFEEGKKSLKNILCSIM